MRRTAYNWVKLGAALSATGNTSFVNGGANKDFAKSQGTSSYLGTNKPDASGGLASESVATPLHMPSDNRSAAMPHPPAPASNPLAAIMPQMQQQMANAGTPQGFAGLAGMAPGLTQAVGNVGGMPAMMGLYSMFKQMRGGQGANDWSTLTDRNYKQADLFGDMSPAVRHGLIGAGVGAGLGGLSSMFEPEEKRKPLSSILTGGLMGGAAGAGGSLLYSHLNKPTAPVVDSPEEPAAAVAPTRAHTAPPAAPTPVSTPPVAPTPASTPPVAPTPASTPPVPDATSDMSLGEGKPAPGLGRAPGHRASGDTAGRGKGLPFVPLESPPGLAMRPRTESQQQVQTGINTVGLGLGGAVAAGPTGSGVRSIGALLRGGADAARWGSGLVREGLPLIGRPTSSAMSATAKALELTSKVPTGTGNVLRSVGGQALRAAPLVGAGINLADAANDILVDSKNEGERDQRAEARVRRQADSMHELWENNPYTRDPSIGNAARQVGRVAWHGLSLAGSPIDAGLVAMHPLHFNEQLKNRASAAANEALAAQGYTPLERVHPAAAEAQAVRDSGIEKERQWATDRQAVNTPSKAHVSLQQGLHAIQGGGLLKDDEPALRQVRAYWQDYASTAPKPQTSLAELARSQGQAPAQAAQADIARMESELALAREYTTATQLPRYTRIAANGALRELPKRIARRQQELAALGS